MRDLLGSLPIIRCDNADYVLTKITNNTRTRFTAFVRRVLRRKKKKKREKSKGRKNH